MPMCRPGVVVGLGYGRVYNMGTNSNLLTLNTCNGLPHGKLLLS